MKTAVLGELEGESIVYNPSLLALAAHYGFSPRACRAYRAKTKGKVERPFRYIRQDFFLGGRFGNLEDLNAQLAYWLATVANARVHGTTRQVVAEHFAQEQPSLRALPADVFNATLKLERRISHEGMVSVGGNLYSVPEGTRSRAVEVHTLAHEIRIFEAGRLIGVHAVLEGRGQRLGGPGTGSSRAVPSSPSALPVCCRFAGRGSRWHAAPWASMRRWADAWPHHEERGSRFRAGSHSRPPGGPEDAARTGNPRSDTVRHRAR